MDLPAQTQTSPVSPPQNSQSTGKQSLTPYQENMKQGYAALDSAEKEAFQNTSHLEKALDCFLNAIESEPQNYRGYFGLGYLYSLIRNKDRALYFLEKAFELDPKNTHLEDFLEATQFHFKSTQESN